MNSQKIKRQKAKGKRQKSELRGDLPLPFLLLVTQGKVFLKLLPFAFCLLIYAFTEMHRLQRNLRYD